MVHCCNNHKDTETLAILATMSDSIRLSIVAIAIQYFRNLVTSIIVLEISN